MGSANFHGRDCFRMAAGKLCATRSDHGKHRVRGFPTTPPRDYSVNWSYFATAGVNNAPLHALATTAATPDGRFAYGGGSAFPTGARHQAANSG